MEKIMYKTFSLDGDVIEVKFRYDSDCSVWHGDYPDFKDNPRYTSSGKPWINVTRDDCKYSTSRFGDCGGCEHLLKQNQSDLIGICMNNKLKKYAIDNKEAT